MISLSAIAVLALFFTVWFFELEDVAWNAGLDEAEWDFEPDRARAERSGSGPHAWLKLPPPAEAPAQPGPEQTAPASPLANVVIAAPDPSLLEQGAQGRLPRVGPDGRQAWQVYGRPFDSQSQRPRIAVLVAGLGLSRAATERAIERLPGAVTLGFAPYARQLDDWLEVARAAGHEVLLEVPMEPPEFPRDDPGPFTLLTSLDAERNLERLEWALSRGAGYVGAGNLAGGRFAAARESLEPVFEALKARGLMFLDGRTEDRVAAARLAADLELPYAAGDLRIDQEASRAAIDGALKALERQARTEGSALGIALPYPVSVERIAQWADTLERKKIELVPVTALVDRRASP